MSTPCEYPCEYPGQVPLSCNTIGAPKPKADVLADEDELLLKREVLRALTGTRGHSRVLSRRAGGRGRPAQGHARSSQPCGALWAVGSRRCNKIRVRTLARVGQPVTLRSRLVCSFASVGLFVCFGLVVCLFVSLRFVCLCVYVYVCFGFFCLFLFFSLRFVGISLFCTLRFVCLFVCSTRSSLVDCLCVCLRSGCGTRRRSRVRSRSSGTPRRPCVLYIVAPAVVPRGYSVRAV